MLPEYASGFDPRGVGAEHAEPLDGPFVTMLRHARAGDGGRGAGRDTLPADGGRRPRGERGRRGRRDRRAGRASTARCTCTTRSGTGSPTGSSPVPRTRRRSSSRSGGLTFGVLTCYDLRFPESARRLVDAGAAGARRPRRVGGGPAQGDALAHARDRAGDREHGGGGRRRAGRARASSGARSLVAPGRRRRAGDGRGAAGCRTVDLDGAALAARPGAEPVAGATGATRWSRSPEPAVGRSGRRRTTPATPRRSGRRTRPRSARGRSRGTRTSAGSGSGHLVP